MNRKRNKPRFSRRDHREITHSSPPPDPSGPDHPAPHWSGRLAQLALGTAFSRIMRMPATLLLGIGGLILGIAWNSGPGKILEQLHFKRLSLQIEGRIIDSWLALDVDLVDKGDNPRWRAFARASPCVVVEYDPGQWHGPLQKAFCGAKNAFTEAYTLHDLDQLAPQVPFSWQRDGRGFTVPEIRLDPVALDMLASNPPMNAFMHPAAKTALEELRIELDRPVDHALPGWAAGRLPFPLAIDPANPIDALPAGFIAERATTGSNWFIFLWFAAFGLAAWTSGMRLLFAGLREGAIWAMTLLPLFAIPWWADHLPRVLRVVDVQVGTVIGDMFHDLDPLGRMFAGEAIDAPQAAGARLHWHPDQGVYAETFGKIAFSLPASLPDSADAALKALAESVRIQVRSMAPDDRVSLFSRLIQDKAKNLPHAGLIFLPAAKELLLAPEQEASVRSAARGFLSLWVTQPVLEPSPRDSAFQQRTQFFRELTSIPVPEIANQARWIVERAEAAL